MKALLGFREQLQKLYSVVGFYLRKVVQFILALVIFQSIGKTLGYMPILTSSMVLMALALVCMLLPVSWTVFVSVVLILGHIFKVNLIVMGLTAVVLLLVYIFYLRFAAMYSWVVLITAVACGLKLGFVIPVVLALTGGPFTAFAAGVGIFGYYFLNFLGEYAATASSSKAIADVISQATIFTKSSFGNKEMWLTIVIFVVVTFVIYFIRRLPIPYAWEIAVAAGAAASFLTNAIAGGRLDCALGAGTMMTNMILMLIAGVILILLLHTVDYSETRKIQFEDDEYYYYVKAVPKLSIAPPKKEVKTFGAKPEKAAPAENEEPLYDEEYEQDEPEMIYEEDYFQDDEDIEYLEEDYDGEYDEAYDEEYDEEEYR